MSTVPLTTVRTPAKDRTRANTLKRERHEPEYGILVATVALAAIGILMVYSSSAIKAYLSKGNDAFAIVGPQIQWAALGLVAMVVMIASGWEIYNASPLFPFRFPRSITLGGWLAGALLWTTLKTQINSGLDKIGKCVGDSTLCP